MSEVSVVVVVGLERMLPAFSIVGILPRIPPSSQLLGAQAIASIIASQLNAGSRLSARSMSAILPPLAVASREHFAALQISRSRQIHF